MGNAKSLIGKSKLQRLSPKTLTDLQKNVDVYFTAEEIQEWFHEYQVKLDKGMSKLTKNDFKEVYNSVFNGDASSFVDHLFRCFDTDGDGFVDFKEFIVGLCVSSSENTDTKLKWAFNMYDIDGNGMICKEEMTQIFKAICKMTNAVERGEKDYAEELSTRFFEKFDLNRDGYISMKEFKDGAIEDPIIVKLLECDPEPDI